MSIPIIDSHIHIFPAAHLETLAWHSLSNPLGTQHSVCEYRQASSSALHTDNDSTYLKGFVFLETDRISSLAPQSWNHALDEVSFLARIAAGTPLPGEGHETADRELCLAIVPWAPVPAGPQSLLEYLTLVRERTQTDEIWKKVTGVRYLVQDKPAGTMLGDRFVESLRWLGREGFSFDLGVEARQGGLWQLEEAIEMFQKVFTNEHGEVDLNAGPKIVISWSYPPFLITSVVLTNAF
jgi:L-rhamnono-1,4-lactonase